MKGYPRIIPIIVTGLVLLGLLTGIGTRGETQNSAVLNPYFIISIFVATLCSFISWMNYQKKKIQWLYAHGIKIEAKIDKIELVKGSISVMGKTSEITCTFTDSSTRQTYTFKSLPSVTLPNYEFKTRGETVEVLVDPKNYRKYFVIPETIGKKKS